MEAPLTRATMLNPPIFTLLTLLCISMMQATSALHFEHPVFDNGNLSDITFVKQDPSWYVGQDASHIDTAIWLNPNPNEVQTRKASNVGRIIYKDPIQFTPGMSFTTCFSFQLITTASYGLCGSGFTFFISDSKQAPTRSAARYLGLVNPNAKNEGEVSHVFAIEFDTHDSENLDDISASHMGVDIDSVVSLAYADSSPGSSLYPRLFLYNNYTFTTWVDYNASSNLIQVWMTNSTSTNPASLATRPDPDTLILRYAYNLSSVFRGQLMYMGFSATNNASEDGMQGAALYSWSFTNEGTAKGSRSQGIPKPVLHIVLPILGGCLLVTAVCLSVFCCRRRKIPKSKPNLVSEMSSRGPRMLVLRQYTRRELRKATEGFSETNKVGEGAFSFVYKGTLDDGSVIAVKKLKQGIRKEDEFSSEIEIISACRHRNLLELQGWCYEKDEAMLVYRFMKRGSLNHYLYGKKKATNEVLDSQKRLTILLDIALALDYMHTGLDTCVLHRDVKAANVILADNFKAMLADFGFSRLMKPDEKVVITSGAIGTIGSIAPEVIDGKATDKSDVYSYGVLALEVAYGRKMIDSCSSEHPYLLDWVWALKESDKLTEGLDLVMRESMPPHDLERWRRVVHIALLCCDPAPEMRPTMREVAQALQGDTQGILTMPLPLTRPPYSDSLLALSFDAANAGSVVFLSAVQSQDFSLSDGLSRTISPTSEIQSTSTSSVSVNISE
ncbi:hypothetical protein L7F22_049125 [Adiantum nelumboides]|nr:hypothetical protein [Adiantum nelumboides]